MILDQDGRKSPQVLFLCTHNTARSQMAEALLRKHAEDRFEVYSAGFESRDINPFTRQVMAEVGIDLGGQYSKGVKEEDRVQKRGGISPPRPHRSGREPLGSSGSHRSPAITQMVHLPRWLSDTQILSESEV